MSSSESERRIRARSPWWRREPSISEILAEPIVRAVMQADGVEPEELAAILYRARQRLLKSKTVRQRVEPLRSRLKNEN